MLSLAEKSIPMPSNLEAEYAILGALLSRNELLAHAGSLTESDFLEPLNGKLFSAIAAKIRNGETANPVVLSSQFDKAYLAGVYGYSLAVFDIRELVTEITLNARKRTLIYACQNTIEMLTDNPLATPEEAACFLNREMEAVTEKDTARSAKDNYHVTVEILEDARRQKEPISTGYGKLDNAMGGGLHPGKSYGFAARKKVGKTILASSISFNLNKAGKRHLFICGEMGPKEIHQRNLARELSVFPSCFRGGFNNNIALQKRIIESAHNDNRCILYQNAPGMTFEDLRRYCSAAIYSKGIEGIILDYWQLVGGKGKGQSTSEHLDTVAQWIADFCRQHQVWSIVMAQINQEGNTRGGEGIRLAFDQVYQINREDLSQPQMWLEMMDTRYTAWLNVGSEITPGFYLREKGPFFEENL